MVLHEPGVGAKGIGDAASKLSHECFLIQARPAITHALFVTSDIIHYIITTKKSKQLTP